VQGRIAIVHIGWFCQVNKNRASNDFLKFHSSPKIISINYGREGWAYFGKKEIVVPSELIFRARKLVKPEDLNSRNVLFGGRLMAWIDEECAIYSACQMGTPMVVTKYISELNFQAPAYQGDVVEIGVATESVGRSSLTVRCVVRSKLTNRIIISVDRMVYVAVGANGRAMRHKLSSEADKPVRRMAG
jgi:acyl-CoA hydrolase